MKTICYIITEITTERGMYYNKERERERERDYNREVCMCGHERVCQWIFKSSARENEWIKSSARENKWMLVETIMLHCYRERERERERERDGITIKREKESENLQQKKRKILCAVKWCGWEWWVEVVSRESSVVISEGKRMNVCRDDNVTLLRRERERKIIITTEREILQQRDYNRWTKTVQLSDVVEKWWVDVASRVECGHQWGKMNECF